MTKQVIRDTPAGRDRPVEIEVTPEMIEAGYFALREFPMGGDLRLILEDVFRAMSLERTFKAGD